MKRLNWIVGSVLLGLIAVGNAEAVTEKDFEAMSGTRLQLIVADQQGSRNYELNLDSAGHLVATTVWSTNMSLATWIVWADDSIHYYTPSSRHPLDQILETVKEYSTGEIEANLHRI